MPLFVWLSPLVVFILSQRVRVCCFVYVTLFVDGLIVLPSAVFVLFVYVGRSKTVFMLLFTLAVVKLC